MILLALAFPLLAIIAFLIIYFLLKIFNKKSLLIPIIALICYVSIGFVWAIIAAMENDTFKQPGEFLTITLGWPFPLLIGILDILSDSN